MPDLIWRDIRYAHGTRTILDDVSLRLKPGELVALIGPNGAGKSTLLRVGLGLLDADSGDVHLDGAPIASLAAVARARRIAYLPQVRPLAWPLRVGAVVALGRFAYGAPLQAPKGADADAIRRAISTCRLEALIDRSTDTLSGGELARVHIARALAAETPLLLADEPAASLDPLHAFETMSILKAFSRNHGGALVTLHDLSLAARFADRVVLLDEGRLLADGPPGDVLTPALLARAFGVRASVSGHHVAIDGIA